MALSNELVSAFVEVTNDQTEIKKESTVYGTVKLHDGTKYVMLDGSDMLTPISTTVDAEDGERVTVLIKDHTATVTGNTTSPAARTDTVTDLDEQVNGRIDNLDVEFITVDELEAEKAVIKEAIIEELDAEFITVDELEAEKAVIKEAIIEELDAEFITVDELEAEKAAIDQLYAKKAEVEVLEADVAEIDTLIFGSASGDVIQSSFSNAVVAQISDAQIKSAMIQSLTASKITAGDIVTNDVRVVSEDGKLLIADETIQISDETRVRVQIGKDASGDYSISIWDADGNLMFSEGGITDSAIKNAIIRNDMVSDDANISAGKLDISSLFTEINNSTETINSTKIYLDDEAQTLDIAFKTMSSEVDELSDDVTSQGTAISVIQGQINSKVWLEDIRTEDEVNADLSELQMSVETLTTQYSELDQELDSISATVASHTTELTKKADTTTVTEVSNKVTEVEADLEGLRTSVTQTYVTKDELENYSTTEEMQSAIDQSANSITSTVSRTYATKEEVDDIEVGGRNLLLDTKAFGNLYAGAAELVDETYNDFAVRYHLNEAAAAVKAVEWNGIKIEKYEQQFTFSFWAKGTGQIRSYMDVGADGGVVASQTVSSQGVETSNCYVIIDLSADWTRYWTTWTMASSGNLSKTNLVSVYTGAGSEVYICGPKLEIGNKATDWSPAPEDTDSKVDDAQDTADEANGRLDDTNDRVYIAESKIQQLSDSISMLVTDENGASLMTQTADGGWTFCTAETSNAINDLQQQMDELQNETGDVNATVTILQQTVTDMGETLEYVQIGTWEGEPCIELGESDSDFSLMITNTRILFRVGSSTPTRITTNGLVTQNIEIENELVQGYWTWKMRANGNYGFRWTYTGIKIITQPQDIIVTRGVEFTISVDAIGKDLTYQWYYASHGTSNWSKATSGTHTSASWVRTIASTSTITEQLVRCKITDSYGNSVTTREATIHIMDPATSTDA